MKKAGTKKSVRKKLSVWHYLKNRDTILATISVFLIMGLLALIPINTHILDPFKLALHDFNYNDLVYSKMGKNKNTSIDTNIVVVNIADAGRLEIAQMIQKSYDAKAKVIGVDVLFKVAKDPSADSVLNNTFNTKNNVVMAYNLYEDHSIFKPEGYFFNQAKNKGYANFVGEEEGVIRYFKPEVAYGNLNYLSFASAIVKVANPITFDQLSHRRKDFEIINYRKSSAKYLVVSGEKLINGEISTSILTNKIVLLGYVGKNEKDIEDKHYTPLNAVFTGRGVPDMNGIFIHANIISMAIDDAYVHQTPNWINWTIAFLLCWIHIAFFIKYSLEGHIWFHLKAKLVSLTMAVLFVYLGLWFFYYFDTQINMTLTLAAVILALDVLYFYESFALWLHKNWGFKTVFHHDVH
ncbi:CHASE2 domain-containing protein [Pedobacter changchengzhani]|uniref:CHASE2 domain-containing protein n=1 Tax=Pedobacter changchengzhani TaxID=2529274 RepID=A0A4R5MPT4_9SPHI|nr:CHASE2 domain-containing protein [Pedobacter changchengzhani]TDG37821.1 CHASE2 domain-containing protein [Pedobacter changchengzhani]